MFFSDFFNTDVKKKKKSMFAEVTQKHVYDDREDDSDDAESRRIEGKRYINK